VLFGPNQDGTGIAFDDPADAQFIAEAAIASTASSSQRTPLDAIADAQRLLAETVAKLNPDDERDGWFLVRITKVREALADYAPLWASRDACRKCGSTEVVQITPATPGPHGCGGPCKACGEQWSIDIADTADAPPVAPAKPEADDDDAEAKCGICNGTYGASQLCPRHLQSTRDYLALFDECAACRHARHAHPNSAPGNSGGCVRKGCPCVRFVPVAHTAPDADGDSAKVGPRLDHAKIAEHLGSSLVPQSPKWGPLLGASNAPVSNPPVWHMTSKVIGVRACGNDEPNSLSTAVPSNVTCPECIALMGGDGERRVVEAAESRVTRCALGVVRSLGPVTRKVNEECREHNQLAAALHELTEAVDAYNTLELPASDGEVRVWECDRGCCQIRRVPPARLESRIKEKDKWVRWMHLNPCEPESLEG
jgi:hypothetical protein